MMAGSKYEGFKAGASVDETKGLVERTSGTKQPVLNQPGHETNTEWQNFMSTCFQLPHRDYPQDGHSSCVYTIQLSGKWLVSGSADKTIRVWDLETRRLRGSSLIRHSQSVLCLQFDPSENEDVIISGSVDASVIVWRFSTGQPIKIIPGAHQESILDLRFNKRHLFTASKDKTVKIWSRHELSPLDKEYPQIRNGPETSTPDYIIDVSSVGPSFIEAGLASGSIQTLEPYTHLATLQSHKAAVNAIDIHENMLFSASGDASIRAWDTSTGECIHYLFGTWRGRACIQSNGKQVVTGGSDNSIHIHDLDTGDEMAVLLGHSSLVRGLQVDFEGFISAVLDKPAQARQRLGNGQEWNRIVSGSYDESIIFWKKDTQGRWSVEHTLQMDAVSAWLSNPDHATQLIATDAHRDVESERPQQEPTLRIFKVKFDARRLVCSSQDSRIYCWDFANDRAGAPDQDVDDGQ